MVRLLHYDWVSQVQNMKTTSQEGYAYLTIPDLLVVEASYSWTTFSWYLKEMHVVLKHGWMEDHWFWLEQ